MNETLENRNVDEQVDIPEELPVLPLRDMVVYPFIIAPLSVAREVSIQAVVLQMATKKKWGEPFKLDPLTVSMKHPSAAAALLAGGQAVKSHFATLPTSFQELASGKIHNVLTSYDVLGGEHSTVAMYNTEKWKKDNPKLYECVWKSYRTAIKWINDNKKEAAALFQSSTTRRTTRAP